MLRKRFRIGRLAGIGARARNFRLAGLLTAALLLVPSSGDSQYVLPIGPDGKTAPRAESGVFNRPPQAVAADRRRLAAALAALKPQRPGVVDAYVVVAALNSDPVFGREAREAGQVLARRFDADGRTIVLGPAGPVSTGFPGSPDSLAAALAHVGQLADRREDAIILYTTSHGTAAAGLEYNDAQRGFDKIRPDRLAAMLAASGMANRLVMLSACYSGVFLPRLASDTSIVISAAAPDRPSFGCSPGNDWTYFGDALINRALRKPQPVPAAFAEARSLVSQWESRGKLRNSNPQISIGKDVARWLGPLEQRMPAQATRPVGRSPAGANAR